MSVLTNRAIAAKLRQVADFVEAHPNAVRAVNTQFVLSPFSGNLEVESTIEEAVRPAHERPAAS